jgi:hypothetical protein
MCGTKRLITNRREDIALHGASTIHGSVNATPRWVLGRGHYFEATRIEINTVPKNAPINRPIVKVIIETS